MQVSLAWLNEWLDTPVSAQALAAQLTMAGLEVDAVEAATPAFSGVVVAEIQACDPHPDADRLRVCTVFDGERRLQVVCGAANAAVGLRVPLARVGACLPDALTIRKGRLRGVESEGMLCGASELGLEDAVEGLLVLPADAPLGADLRAYLGLDDSLLMLDLTPNRGDCLSLLGLAREVAVLQGIACRSPDCAPVPAALAELPAVTVLSSRDCPRYVGRIVRGVDLSVPSPLWLRERLRRGGIRSINVAVDVTNLVMLELGQPMHAFDLDRLQGGIEVRHARPGERLALLDGHVRDLQGDTLVIADGRGPLALAGIMGGQDSGVTAQTRHVLLEAAFFEPVALAGKARQYGLHTDSSHRFERGVDPEATVRAMERATRLLLALAGGQAGPVLDCRSAADLPVRPLLMLRPQTIARVLGLSLDAERVTAILTGLGCAVDAVADGWQVRVPDWRFDIAREVDLIEELARVYGYDRLPTAMPACALAFAATDETRPDADDYRDCLVQRGYQEAITYSFVDPAWQQALLGDAGAVRVSNPIAADMAAMRLSLWPGLLKALLGNRQRQQQRVRLFEAGLVFQGMAQDQQQPCLAGVVSGSAAPLHWSGKPRALDFFDAKADLEAVLAVAGVTTAVRFVAAPHPALHPGQSARVEIDGVAVGWLGGLHPDAQTRLDVTGSIYLFELFLDKLPSGKIPAFKELSRFPEMSRDIALVLDAGIAVGDVADAIAASAGDWLKSLAVFDVFQAAELGEQQKSVGFTLVFQHPERTLTDEEVAAVMAGIVAAADARFGARLRSG